MKRSFLIAFFLFFIINGSFSKPFLYKTWIGENLEHLEMKKASADFDYGNGIVEFKSSYKNEILTLVLDQKKGWVYSFKVVYLTEDSLIIAPLDKKSAILTRNKDTLIFINKERSQKVPIHFQGILFIEKEDAFFHGLEFFIDSTGIIYLKANKKEGEYNAYKGKLNSDQLNTLTKILSELPLEKFPSELGHEVIGPSEKTFTFYYNNKLKISRGRWVPHAAAPFLEYMLDIYKQVEFGKELVTYKF